MINFLLANNERVRKIRRAEEIRLRLIPQQEQHIAFDLQYNLPCVPDYNILQGLKREYKFLTGKEYNNGR